MGKPEFDPSQPFAPAASAKPAFDPNQAFSSGTTSAPDTTDTRPDWQKNVAAAGIGVERGATLGYLPQIVGGMRTAGQAVTGDLGSDSFADRYLKNRDSEIDNEAAAQRNAPITSTLSEIGGSMLVPVPGSTGTTLAAKAAHGAAVGAGLGFAMNPGDKKGEINPWQLEQRGENAKSGAEIGGGLSAAASMAPALTKAGISTILGPSKEGINKYLEGSERINAAPNLEQMKNSIDTQVGDINNNVLRHETNAANARTDVANAQGQVAGQQANATMDYRQGVIDAGTQAEKAQETFNAQKAAAAKVLTESATHPTAIADDVHQAVGNLKKQVTTGSAEAAQILADSGAKVQTKPLVDQLMAAHQSMFPEDVGAITPQAKAAKAQLEELIEGVKKMPDQVSGPAAKKLVQQIDAQADWVREQGGFGTQFDQTLKGLRKGIDSQLKDNTEYSAKMADVSQKTALLDQANQLFGTREKAYASINSIAGAGDGRLPQRQTLGSLGQATGNDFGGTVDKYRSVQDTLKNGMDPIHAALPGAAGVEKAQTLQDMLANPAYRQNRIASEVNQTPLLSAQDKAAQAQHQLEMARAEAEPVRGWTPAATQSKLQSLISKAPGKAGIETTRELEYLNGLRTEAGEPSYSQSIDDNRVRSQFTADQTRGSRNVNMGHALGGAAGGIAGFVMPGAHAVTVPVMSAAGSVLGGYIDKNGGRIAKGALDTYIDNKPMIDSAMKNHTRLTTPWLMMKGNNNEGY